MMNKRKVFFVSFAAIFSIIVILTSNNVFKEDPGYFIVPHGDHNHYVPHDYDRSIGIHQFPQRPPREWERITPDGRIIRIQDMDTGIQFYNRPGNQAAPDTVQMFENPTESQINVERD
ncbi:MAG: pneumococcal-type histidine triad protein [Balneolales bacterium]|nr:pneumococcal-type histidine triad protein [Balneolales bacterium]